MLSCSFCVVGFSRFSGSQGNTSKKSIRKGQAACAQTTVEVSALASCQMCYLCDRQHLHPGFMVSTIKTSLNFSLPHFGVASSTDHFNEPF